MSDKKEKPWKLHIGCHRRTLMSRDTTVREHESLQDCRRDVVESEECWARLGYYVWYAYAVGSTGEKETLHAGTSYC
ncbi:MAG: hypothetical protein Q7R64_04910 [bacterium]|nr:hypothetical protein [bacterium]